MIDVYKRQVVFAKGTEAKAITTGKIVSGNATEKPNGYYKHTLTYSVNNTKVVPGTDVYKRQVYTGTRTDRKKALEASDIGCLVRETEIQLSLWIAESKV